MPESRHLCVSLHDVAPATWRACQRVLAAVRDVADIPLTLLVVPAYHGQCSALAPGFESAMSEQLANGHELALHGYFHRDLGAPVSALDWLRRRVYTAGEGEFCALGRNEAAERLRLGQQWFAANRWPLAGFVPPAWLLGPEGWHALREFPTFTYVTTFSHVHALHTGVAVRAPCLTFSTRTPWRRWVSRAWAQLGWFEAPLARLALHPNDAMYPGLRQAWQRKLEALLRHRQPLTKAEFVRRFANAASGAAEPTRRRPLGRPVEKML